MKKRVVALLLAVPLCAAEAHLKYVVIVTRHGVRAPTWDAKRLREYSAEAWPEWGVPPGYLTPHGREAILKVGAYYRTWLTDEHLLKGCNSHATIYADKDERCIETGRALAEALAPGCGLPTDFQKGNKEDPLFSGSLMSNMQMAAQAVKVRLHRELVGRHKAAFDTLVSILGSPKVMEASEGPFATGATLSENLLLEYANGMQGKDLGWGRLNRDNLFQILEIHTAYVDLMARRGSNFLHHVWKSMEQAASGHAVDGAIGKTGDAVLVISGHDENVSNLAGVLGLRWKLAGYQANDTPPGGALIFCLWQEDDGRQTVRLRYVAQTPDQMRNLDSGAPESQDVALPGCEPCTWNRFEQVVKSHF